MITREEGQLVGLLLSLAAAVVLAAWIFMTMEQP